MASESFLPESGFFREQKPSASRLGGFSLTEVLVVIASIAVLAGILIPTMTNVLQSSKAGLAEGNLEHLNQAVLKYNHSVAELTNEVDADITDEQAVFTVLKTRDAAVPGSPYLPSNIVATSSTNNTTYRAVWNGRMFQIVEPGTDATGVDLANLYDQ